MNSDQPTKKQKNSRDRGADQESRKEKQTTSGRRLFFSAEKMLGLMMELLQSFLGNRPAPKDNRAFFVAVFCMLANGLCWNVLRIERGKWRSVDSIFNRWAKRRPDRTL